MEDEELHHEDLVGVGSAAEVGVVGVHGPDYWSEGFPVYCLVYFGESVSESGDFLVGLVE